MTTAFDKLIKILHLEQRMEYSNKAVIGGLEKYAPYWREEAVQVSSSALGHEMIAFIAEKLISYHSLDDLTQREKLILELLSLLKELNDGCRDSLQPASPAGPAHQMEKQGCDETESYAERGYPDTQITNGPQANSHAAPALPPLEKPCATNSGEKQDSASLPAKRIPEISKPFSHPSARTETVAQPRTIDYELNSLVTSLRSVGEAHSTRLSRLGITTIRDLIFLFPRRYDDYRRLKTIRELIPGDEVTIIANVRDISLRQLGPARSVVKCTISDGTGSMQITWFNQPYMERRLEPGQQIVVSGKVEQYLGRPTMNTPEWEPLEKELIHTGRLVPVYPLTEGVSGRWLRRLVKKTVDYWVDRIPDHLPQGIRSRFGLLDLGSALKEIHFPINLEKVEQARRRLAFDELLVLQLYVLRLRNTWRSQPGISLPIDWQAISAFLDGLPFMLTDAQRRCLDQILTDISEPIPMNRLLQGDVGSGKTIVAAAAALATARAGFQCAIMAPTEILAEQHFISLSHFLEPATVSTRQGERPLRIARLSGSLKPAEKSALWEEIGNGDVDIITGTHALIQENGSFARLGLVIVDEQHRFGVAQRAALRNKGNNPHLLVMTATPIPRTLSLTLFGDLDLSIIDEMPAGRQTIATYIVSAKERERAYHFVQKEASAGHQAFIICPLIEESESIDARAAVEEHQRLQQEVFPNLRVGLLHGRMKGEEKDQVMRQFKAGHLHILVSTAVVEVGIDVPNATVMLIEGANRFGLAQLHQFRGRVGRGQAPSYCLLIAENAGEEGIARLQALAESGDGFALAEKDLEMRGPGEFFGTRQSGLPDLKLASFANVRLLEQARQEAKAILERDPELQHPDHAGLAILVDTLQCDTTDPS